MSFLLVTWEYIFVFVLAAIPWTFKESKKGCSDME